MKVYLTKINESWIIDRIRKSGTQLTLQYQLSMDLDQI